MRTKKFSADELRRGIATLPQELYDEIYNLTFFAAVKETREIDPGDSLTLSMRQDLNLLQVSSDSRALYAASYYGGGSIFEIQCGSGPANVIRWLKSIPAEHRALISWVYLRVYQRFSRFVPSNAWEVQDFLIHSSIHCRKVATEKFGEDIANKIFLVNGPGVYGKRPKAFWPGAANVL